MPRIFEVVVLVLFVSILLVGANAAAGDDTVTRSVTNESLIVNYSDPSAVSKDAIGYDNEHSVYNATGSELANGTDYVWHPNNGTVEWLNTSATTSGEEATISYNYTVEPESSQVVSAVVPALGGGIWIVVFIVMVLSAYQLATDGFGGGGL